MPTILDNLNIATCTVSYGKEASFAGKAATVAIRVTPMAVGIGQLRLTWAATGDMFSSFDDSTAGAAGMPGIIVLPQTGQTGFRHGTSTFKDWFYQAVVTSTLDDGQSQTRTYRFQIPAGMTSLDLDMLDEDGVVTALPAVAPILPQTALSRVGVKTATYTAGPNELVPVDASSAAVAITLPAAPADKSRVLVKKLDTSTNTVTLATATGDVFNKTAGATSVSLQLTNQAVTVQYDAATAIWTVLSDDLPLNQLDIRYPTAASLAATYPALNGGQRLAIGGTQLDPAQIGAEAAGAAAAVTLAGLGGITPTAVDGKVSTAISALIAGAPGALDTLKEIADQLANDETAATALTALVNARAISAASVTIAAAGTLTPNARNALDGSASAFTVTLPAPFKVGQLLLVERIDTSTANTLAVAAAPGATIRGNASATIALPGVGAANEGLLFVAESLTSWAVAAGHKPKSWLDKVYQAATGSVVLPVPNGTDDTAAVQMVLNSGAAQVIAQPGQYKVTALTVPAGVAVIGSVPRTYTGVPAGGTVFLQTGTAAQPVFTLGERTLLDGVGVIGNTFGTGIKATGSSYTVRRCVVTKNVIGIDSNYSGTGLIDANNINTNSGAGIANPVDSSIRDNYLNVNAPGIYLGTGANDNTISGNKLEFNSTNGLSAYQAVHNVVINNVVDRNGSAGLKLVQCKQTSLTGNMLRRNGGSQASGTAGEDCHVHIETSVDTVVGQNTTSVGVNDDGSGYNSPKYAVYVQANSGSTRIVGNSLVGFTSAAFNLVGTNTDYSAAQNATGSAELSTRTRSTLGYVNTTGSVATNATYTFTTVGAPLSTYLPGFLYQLDLVARDTSTGSRTAARVFFTVSREGGNAAVSSLSFTNTLGSEFGASGTTTTVTASTNADGSSVLIVLTNTGTNTKQYSATLS